MDYEKFYAQLFQPIERSFGLFDPNTIFHIIGFDCGGPLNFSTVGRDEEREFVTYVSCELSVRDEQVPSAHGRFELMCHSNDEEWVRKVLTKIGQMSLEVEFGDGHTIDISEIVGPDAPFGGVLIEQFSAVEIDSTEYCILRVHGISTEEMRLAMDEGSDALIGRLKRDSVYPNTDIRRRSAV